MNVARLPVYIPVPGTHASRHIDKGSGIVGSRLENGMVMIDFEGNRYGAVNIRTYADRVRHAWHRAATAYPTVARMVVKPDEVRQVGWFDPDDGRVDVETPTNAVALAEWLGIDVDDDPEQTQMTMLAELRVSS